jgi:hypothetical protein
MPYKDKEKQRAYIKRHYEANKPDYIARARAHDKKVTAKGRAWLLEYLLANPCVDCGEADPIVLEFDHRPGSGKRFDVGAFATGNYSFQSLLDEVAKCDVRCANCHRRITYQRSGRTSRGPATSLADR